MFKYLFFIFIILLSGCQTIKKKSEIVADKTKKYGIPCERKFEINTSGIIIGFSSSGCI